MAKASEELKGASQPPSADLQAAWATLVEKEPGLRPRDAAARLGVGEAALVAGGCGADSVRLVPDWPALLQSLPDLDRVMCLTRNEAVVHERYGRFEEVRAGRDGALVLGPDIDLRINLRHWRHGFAVEQPLPSGRRTSLQFFDAAGDAVHKVYLVADSERAAYSRLVERFRDRERAPGFVPEPIAEATPRADDEIDAAALRKAWDAMTDTHDFGPLLRRLDIQREQALRLAGPDHARPLPPDALQRLLARAGETRQPIMVFVGNRGTIQIHTGPVANVRVIGSWLNVLDDDFNLHLRADRIARVWAVRKPTDDGVVTSVEAYQADGTSAAWFFGERKPGRPEREDWRDLVAELEEEADHAG